MGKVRSVNKPEQIYFPDHTENDTIRFQHITDLIFNTEKIRHGIGTLSEKTIHEVIKSFYCEDPQFQEVRTGTFIADISSGSLIVEIQNGNFNKLRDKLNEFLVQNDVIVVYPIPVEKKVYWLNQETCEITGGRRSPHRGNRYEAFQQFYRIRSVLNHKHLHFHIFLMDMEEYRLLNGWSHDKKRGSSRYDRLPGQLREIMELNCPDDYMQFFPPDLPELFTSKDLSKKAGIPVRLAQYCLLICRDLGIIELSGKQGRSLQYRLAHHTHP